MVKTVTSEIVFVSSSESSLTSIFQMSSHQKLTSSVGARTLHTHPLILQLNNPVPQPSLQTISYDDQDIKTLLFSMFIQSRKCTCPADNTVNIYQDDKKLVGWTITFHQFWECFPKTENILRMAMSAVQLHPLLIAKQEIHTKQDTESRSDHSGLLDW